MKNKLIVLYEENVYNPIGTWSGIPYQLRESLANYFDVVFIDSSDPRILTILKTIAKRIEKYNVSYLLKPLYEKLHKVYINNKLKGNSNIPVLEIAENVELDNNDFYLYRDMSYACYPNVIEKLSAAGKDYGHGTLRHISKKALNNRIVIEKKLINKSKCNFFMGQWAVDCLNKIYPNMADKFLAVGGGLSKEFNCEISSADNKRIIFVGIDYLRKGGDLVTQAFEILKNKYDTDAELIIAGAEIQNKNNDIIYAGRIDKKTLSSLFSKSSVFCMPSRFEAYGLVFLEAQCYGLPIVAYDDFEMHYLVKEGINGYLIKKHDAEELAEALHKVLNNTEMINRVRNNANKFKDNHTWDVVAKKIAVIINERSYGVKND